MWKCELYGRKGYMNQEILITQDRWQTRLALLEEGRLVEHHQEPKHFNGLVGNIYLGKVKRILPSVQSAFIDAGLDRDGFLFEGDTVNAPRGDEENEGGEPEKPVAKMKGYREGDDLLVQLTKEPMGQKGARLTAQISLPGNHLVLVPDSKHVGVSRKLGGEERQRLRKEARALCTACGMGVIIRTSAREVTGEELAAEMQELVELWALIKLRASMSKAPSCVHQEADLIGRFIREVLPKGDTLVKTDDPEIYERCRSDVGSCGLDFSRVYLWKDEKVSLFDKYAIDAEIEKAVMPRVWLASGGCIVLQSTEALVSIDVNSGRCTNKKSLEETAFAINMEAADEIARQVRLRGLGGIIVIDFIDMVKKAHGEAVFEHLKRAFSTDRARTRVLSISAFGLVEMTRKRSHRNLERTMTSVCPCCEGRGRVMAPWRVAQKVAYAVKGMKAPSGTVMVSPEVRAFLEENRVRYDIPSSIRIEAVDIPRLAGFEVVPDTKSRGKRRRMGGARKSVQSGIN